MMGDHGIRINASIIYNHYLKMSPIVSSEIVGKLRYWLSCLSHHFPNLIIASSVSVGSFSVSSLRFTSAVILLQN